MEKRLYGIRGAVCTKNEKDDILKNIELLFIAIFAENKMEASDIVSIQFTVTPDIDELNPATALRKSKLPLDVSKVPLFCSLEPVMKTSLKTTIRVLITAYMENGSSIQNMYMNGAEVLRPDFSKAK